MIALHISNHANSLSENEEEIRKITGINATMLALEDVQGYLNSKLTELRRKQDI